MSGPRLVSKSGVWFPVKDSSPRSASGIKLGLESRPRLGLVRYKVGSRVKIEVKVTSQVLGQKSSPKSYVGVSSRVRSRVMGWVQVLGWESNPKLGSGRESRIRSRVGSRVGYKSWVPTWVEVGSQVAYQDWISSLELDSEVEREF
ncbi:hypothetical protein HAX54_025908 [Datura stramonium]|uniref:Uncharacterized protein n=1 Tax=Datura stramonium TaxID=4076 RepID=A0ABS8S7A2_DATST|nr:hypothetical protein [Datura stramonium]